MLALGSPVRPPRTLKGYNMTEDEYRETAAGLYQGDDNISVDIDAEVDTVEESGTKEQTGAWVAAWIWIPAETAKSWTEE